MRSLQKVERSQQEEKRTASVRVAFSDLRHHGARHTAEAARDENGARAHARAATAGTRTETPVSPRRDDAIDRYHVTVRELADKSLARVKAHGRESYCRARSRKPLQCKARLRSEHPNAFAAKKSDLSTINKAIEKESTKSYNSIVRSVAAVERAITPGLPLGPGAIANMEPGR